MRRTIVVAALAGCGSFCLASATALGGAKLNIWRAFGERFQLGYVVGYLDAANLAKRQDQRASVPTGGKPNYELWRDKVNEFYADPTHANAQLPDAMAAVGKAFQAEIIEGWSERSRLRMPSPDASQTPQAPAAP